MTHVDIFTDGAARGNPDGPGGYGAIIRYVDKNGRVYERELSAGYVRTTNNRMELMAVIAAFERLNKSCDVTVHSDSQYAIGVLSGQMKAKKNLNLIERYKQVSDGKDVSFKWVRGHNGNHWNEVCDQMAHAEYENMKI